MLREEQYLEIESRITDLQEKKNKNNLPESLEKLKEDQLKV